MNKYKELDRILNDAAEQAKSGKGYERHACDEPFESQKICQINRWLQGNKVAGPCFQAVKKTIESSRMYPERAIQELYGAINYLAAAIKLLEEIVEYERFLEGSEPPVFEEETTTNTDTAEEPSDRRCEICKYGLVWVDEMPCKKCIPYEFLPHFRPLDF